MEPEPEADAYAWLKSVETFSDGRPRPGFENARVVQSGIGFSIIGPDQIMRLWRHTEEAACQDAKAMGYRVVNKA